MRRYLKKMSDKRIEKCKTTKNNSLGDELESVLGDNIQLDLGVHPVLGDGGENLVVHSFADSHGKAMVASLVKRGALLGRLLQ